MCVCVCAARKLCVCVCAGLASCAWYVCIYVHIYTIGWAAASGLKQENEEEMKKNRERGGGARDCGMEVVGGERINILSSPSASFRVICRRYAQLTTVGFLTLDENFFVSSPLAEG